MKIDAEKLKKWAEKEREQYRTSLPEVDYDAGKVDSFSAVIRKIDRMVKAEKKKESEG